MTSARCGDARTSRCFHRAVRDYRRVSSKQRLAAGRWLQPMCPAAAKSLEASLDNLQAVTGCREIARQNYNALLVPTDDTAALAAAIDKLTHDADLRRRFGASSRRLVETEFSAARIGGETVALYNRLLDAPLHAPPAHG